MLVDAASQTARHHPHGCKVVCGGGIEDYRKDARKWRRRRRMHVRIGYKELKSRKNGDHNIESNEADYLR